MENPAKRPQSYVRGQAITAAQLNELVEATRRFSSHPGETLEAPGPPGGIALAAVTITNIEDDYLACETEAGIVINVARPSLLRASLDSHNGIDFTYSSATEREASDGEDTETQVIVPAYAVGDTLIALGLVDGTGVEDAPDWLDLNVDARAWAKAAE